MAAQLKELGEEALEERLQLAAPCGPSSAWPSYLQRLPPRGRPVLVFELARGADTAASSKKLGELAAQLVAAEAEAPAHLLRLAAAMQRCSAYLLCFAAAMQRCSSWLAAGPLPAADAGGTAAAAAPASLDIPGGACLA